MNVFEFAMYFSAFFWALFFQRSLLVIMLLILSVYLAFHYLFKSVYKIHLRKKINQASWHKCQTPYGYLKLYIDTGALERATKEPLTDEGLKGKNQALVLQTLSLVVSRMSNKANTFFGHIIPAKRIILRYQHFRHNEIETETLIDFHKLSTEKAQKQQDLFRQMPDKPWYRPILTMIPRYLRNSFGYFLFFIKTAIKLHTGDDNFHLALIRNYTSLEIEDSHFPTTLRELFTCALCKAVDRVEVEGGKPVVKKTIMACFTFDTRVLRLEDFEEFATLWNEAFGNLKLIQ